MPGSVVTQPFHLTLCHGAREAPLMTQGTYTHGGDLHTAAAAAATAGAGGGGLGTSVVGPSSIGLSMLGPLAGGRGWAGGRNGNRHRERGEKRDSNGIET